MLDNCRGPSKRCRLRRRKHTQGERGGSNEAAVDVDERHGLHNSAAGPLSHAEDFDLVGAVVPTHLPGRQDGALQGVVFGGPVVAHPCFLGVGSGRARRQDEQERQEPRQHFGGALDKVIIPQQKGH